MTAQSRPYAEVIGDPIDHSLSPVIHAFWLEQLGISADYFRAHVSRGGLGDYLDRRRADPLWRGSNVTMPLKLDALTLSDDSSDRALGAGAANIILPRQDKLLAGNTDVGGVATLVDRLAKAGAPMGSITVLGTGGGARAALMGLRLLGLTAVCLQSRDQAEAYKLAVQFKLQAEPVPFDTPVRSDGLINCTPLGMTGQPPLALDFSGMPDSGWVFDFVTAPQDTELLKAAADREMRTIGGVELLLEQAAESFRLLFNQDAPRDKDADLRQKLAT